MGDGDGSVAYMEQCYDSSDCDTSYMNYVCDMASDGYEKCFCQNGMEDDEHCGQTPPEPEEEEEEAMVSPTGFVCNMDGYVNIVDEGMEVALAGISILKQIGSAILPADLRTAVDYAWKGIKGAGSWIGFALAAAFFAAKEFDFGEQMCMGFGYVDMGLGYAVMAVTALDQIRDMIPV